MRICSVTGRARRLVGGGVEARGGGEEGGGCRGMMRGMSEKVRDDEVEDCLGGAVVYGEEVWGGDDGVGAVSYLMWVVCM